MKASLQFKVSQSLALSPQLQQAIRLLQLSRVELQAEIQNALDSNIMLELDENDSKTVPTLEKDLSTDEPDSTLDSPQPADAEQIPDELPIDSSWEDIFDIMQTAGSKAGISTSDIIEQQYAPEKSLREHLLWQLTLTPLAKDIRLAAEAIIDALDEDGYFTSNIDSITALLAPLRVNTTTIIAALQEVQNLDPTGVGARDLQECILLQLQQCPADMPWLLEAQQLVAKHFSLLTAHDFKQLMRQMQLTQPQLQAVIALVQSLNPRPGSKYYQTQTQYIIPDVYVKKTNGKWSVELNTDTIPKLRVNKQYAGMVRRADNSTDNTSLKTHLQEARWLIKNLKSRNHTLLSVANCIVAKQSAFLEHGESNMQPLIMREIAEKLDLHGSTISRATSAKYMHTPRGVFEFKYFFSSHVDTKDGQHLSSTAIRSMIKKLIAAEIPQRPLSDSKISNLLLAKGINIARRTVAKYRESMAIATARERKSIS